jgi:hypothetical protein
VTKPARLQASPGQRSSCPDDPRTHAHLADVAPRARQYGSTHKAFNAPPGQKETEAMPSINPKDPQATRQNDEPEEFRKHNDEPEFIRHNDTPEVEGHVRKTAMDAQDPQVRRRNDDEAPQDGEGLRR